MAATILSWLNLSSQAFAPYLFFCIYRLRRRECLRRLTLDRLSVSSEFPVVQHHDGRPLQKSLVWTPAARPSFCGRHILPGAAEGHISFLLFPARLIAGRLPSLSGSHGPAVTSLTGSTVIFSEGDGCWKSSPKSSVAWGCIFDPSWVPSSPRCMLSSIENACYEVLGINVLLLLIRLKRFHTNVRRAVPNKIV